MVDFWYSNNFTPSVYTFFMLTTLVHMVLIWIYTNNNHVFMKFLKKG